MYSVVYSHTAQLAISRYIRRYRDLFIALYTDTGLGQAEHIIQEQYNTTARNLAKRIKELTETHMKTVEILGYSQKDKEIRETTLSIENRRIFIRYREDATTRYIEDITIVRK